MNSVLAIDTSGPSSHIAVSTNGIVVERVVVGALSHDEQLAATVQEVVRGAGCAPKAISDIVLGIGPGSFTGLRIGLAFAQGLALASGAALSIASSLRATAYCARGRSSFLVAFSDARRGELFLGGWCTPHVKPREFLSERIVSVSEMVGVVNQCIEDSGTPKAEPIYVGDPALVEKYLSEGAVIPPDGLARSLIDIFAEGEVKTYRGSKAISTITPRYLREVSAKSISERQGGASI